MERLSGVLTAKDTIRVWSTEEQSVSLLSFLWPPFAIPCLKLEEGEMHTRTSRSKTSEVHLCTSLVDGDEVSKIVAAFC